MSHTEASRFTGGTEATRPPIPDPIRPLPARTAAAVVAEVLVPLIARGLIIRRPRALRALALIDADRRAVERLRSVRATHGPGPVLVKLPLRNLALILTGGDARRVLDGSPEPFTPANREKRAALARFEPHGVLIAPLSERPRRRVFNERALETGKPVHGCAPRLIEHVTAEADALLGHTRITRDLGWEEFQQAFNRIVRGVVLGDTAVADQELSDQLNALRRDANWAYLRPPRRARRERFLAHLQTYLERPDPAALSGHIAAVAGTGADAVQEAVDQVPHWLFAFDAAAIASFAALALLSTHAGELSAARAEIERSASGGTPPELPFLRACVLEVLRLWPTTPALLRDAGEETDWPAGRLPRGSTALIFAPLFHRAVTLQPDADTFSPERWLDLTGDGTHTDDSDPRTTLVPFSAGAGRCPARELVLLVTSQLLARLLELGEYELTGPLAGRLAPDRPLPTTLDHFRLAFRTRPREHADHRQTERTAL